MVAGAELRHIGPGDKQLYLSGELASCTERAFLSAHQPAHSPQRKAACFTTRTPRVAVQSSSSLPVVRPLLITPGQCAELVDEESEDLTGVWPLGYCQELLIVCIYLCGQFLKCRKVANVTKTGKSTERVTLPVPLSGYAACSINALAGFVSCFFGLTIPLFTKFSRVIETLSSVAAFHMNTCWLG